jgi:uncharacterized damage-inducible protein DinB
MSPPTAPLLMMFKINDTLMARSLDGLTDEQLWHRATEHNNPILWLFGHVAQTRARILNVLGGKFDTGWGDSFVRGAAVGERAKYASQAEIAAAMRDINQRLYRGIEAAAPDQLAQPATGPVPMIKTVEDLLTFLTMHESYHVGQMAYIRKALGFPGLVG